MAGFTDEQVAAVLDSNGLSNVDDEYIVMLDTAAKAGDFVTSYCSSVPESMQEDMEEGEPLCVSTAMAAAGVAFESDACRDSNRYSADEMGVMDKDCLTAAATALGLSTATIDTLHTALAGRHTACQTKTTEATCLAYDASEYNTILSDTEVVMKVASAADTSSALPQKAGVGMTIAATVAFAAMLA